MLVLVVVEFDLFEQQEAPQEEAATVAEDLQLEQRLSAVGAPVRVGAAALGVMVRRDLDITVICAELDQATHRAVAAAGAGWAVHPRVRSVQFRDDTGSWNTDPAYPDGLYLGLQYRCVQGQDWTLDVWFVDEPHRQPDLAHLRELRPALTPDRRAAVLAIKQARSSRPEHRARTSSYDVYRAVVEDDVRTPEQFDRWLHRRAR